MVFDLKDVKIVLYEDFSAYNSEASQLICYVDFVVLLVICNGLSFCECIVFFLSTDYIRGIT